MNRLRITILSIMSVVSLIINAEKMHTREFEIVEICNPEFEHFMDQLNNELDKIGLSPNKAFVTIDMQNGDRFKQLSFAANFFALPVGDLLPYKAVYKSREVFFIGDVDVLSQMICRSDVPVFEKIRYGKSTDKDRYYIYAPIEAEIKTIRNVIRYKSCRIPFKEEVLLNDLPKWCVKM